MNRIWDSTLKRFIRTSKCDTQNSNSITAWFVCTFIHANFITELSHWDQSEPNSSLDEWFLETSKQLSEPLEEGKGPQNNTFSRKNKFLHPVHASWTSKHGPPLSPFKKSMFSMIFTQTKGLNWSQMPSLVAKNDQWALFGAPSFI